VALHKIRRFDRGDHVLVIDTATGNKWREQKDGPGTFRKAVNFSAATIKHVRKGRPRVSQDVIEKRFAVCSDCPDGLFVELGKDRLPKRLHVVEGVVGTCRDRRCGCYIHASEAFPNKLAWATTKCPMEHWEEIE
jgi:hypothetical protein